MLRDVHRAVTSLASPFKSIDSFEVKFKTNKKEWLKGLLTFDDIKAYALYSGVIEIEGNAITKFVYEFSPFSNMFGMKARQFSIDRPVKMLIPPNKKNEKQKDK